MPTNRIGGNPRGGRTLRAAVTLILVAGFVGLVSIKPACAAEPRGHRSEKTPEQRLAETMAEFKAVLGLTAEQETAVSAVYLEYYQKQQALRDQFSGQGKGGGEAMRGERQKLQDELKAKLTATLTEDQMKKWQAYQDEKQGERRKKWGERGKSEKDEGEKEKGQEKEE